MKEKKIAPVNEAYGLLNDVEFILQGEIGIECRKGY